jgi:superfamily I DNA and/or RNA helicase
VVVLTAQATVPESLIPLSFATEPSCSVVLAGDPHQLGPVVHSSQAMAAGFGTSLLEMFMKVRRNARDGEGVNASAPVDGMVQLVRNYRSHQDLLDLPSQLFYGGVLRSACRSEDVTLPGTLSESYDLSASPPLRTLARSRPGVQRLVQTAYSLPPGAFRSVTAGVLKHSSEVKKLA